MAAAGSTGTFPLHSVDCIATRDEKSTYLARGSRPARRGESSVEAREGRSLAPSLDKGSERELLQLRVRGAGMRRPYLSGSGWGLGWSHFLASGPL
jgi:hypothetical protein